MLYQDFMRPIPSACCCYTYCSYCVSCKSIRLWKKYSRCKLTSFGVSCYIGINKTRAHCLNLDAAAFALFRQCVRKAFYKRLPIFEQKLLFAQYITLFFFNYLAGAIEQTIGNWVEARNRGNVYNQPSSFAFHFGQKVVRH